VQRERRLACLRLRRMSRCGAGKPRTGSRVPEGIQRHLCIGGGGAEVSEGSLTTELPIRTVALCPYGMCRGSSETGRTPPGSSWAGPSRPRTARPTRPGRGAAVERANPTPGDPSLAGGGEEVAPGSGMTSAPTSTPPTGCCGGRGGPPRAHIWTPVLPSDGREGNSSSPATEGQIPTASARAPPGDLPETSV
jgi:hypothetical protein